MSGGRTGGAGRRGTRRAGRLAVALLTAALGAPTGCATLGPALASLRPLPRACAGPLPPVAALGADFALQARYRVRSGGRERALLLAAEKRGDRLVLLGLDPLGTHVFTLVQEGSAVRREEHLRPLFPFPPENALRDFVRARLGDGPEGAADGARVEPDGQGVRIQRPSCAWDATVELVPKPS